jgi:hypothetical protein
MIQTRWKEIETLFTTASQMLAEERSAFLSDCCSEDPEIYNEVTSLLKEIDENDHFLEGNVLTLGLSVIRQNKNS